MSIPPSLAPALPRIALVLLWLGIAVPVPAADPGPKPAATPPPGAAGGAEAPLALERGATVKVVRAEDLRYYGKPSRKAKVGETFEVLDVRPATAQVFVGVKEGGRLIALSLPLDAVVPVLPKAKEKARRIEQSEALFAGLIPTINLVIPEAGIERLRKDPRSYVEATIEEAGGKKFEHIGIKLKGSVGSFQPIDERPGFSLKCDKFEGGEPFHGLKRFQLNNCNQDGSALNELISGEIARKAGVPASRCTHALVSVNGRALGIYVLKEGFSAEFLAAFFADTSGHLYDGGFCADIRADMELDRGDPAKQERLKELLAAIEEPDPARQFERLSKVVDVSAYLRHLALENILCHWDGYSYNRNNYRLYEDPKTGRFHFILHGMDQMFGDAALSLHREPGGVVGAILWRNPKARAQYERELTDVYEKVIKPVDWGARIEGVGRRLLLALHGDRARDYEGNIHNAGERVRARMANVRQQMESVRLLAPLGAPKGQVALGGLIWSPETDNAVAEEPVVGGRRCLYLRATGDADAAWRLALNLPPGKYRLEGLIRTKRVVALPDAPGEGAGLRLAGGSREGQHAVTGDADWKKVGYEFQAEGSEHILRFELKAKAGEVWADRASLKLTRLP